MHKVDVNKIFVRDEIDLEVENFYLSPSRKDETFVCKVSGSVADLFINLEFKLGHLAEPTVTISQLINLPQ